MRTTGMSYCIYRALRPLDSVGVVAVGGVLSRLLSSATNVPDVRRVVAMDTGRNARIPCRIRIVGAIVVAAAEPQVSSQAV